MDKDLIVVFVFVVALALFAIVGFSISRGHTESYDRCINYYSDLSVTDARKLCHDIVNLGSKGK